MEGIFTLGLERCIEVLQQSKTDEDRPEEGTLCTSSKEGGGQGSAAWGKGWEPWTQIWIQSPISLPTAPSQASDFFIILLLNERFFKFCSALQSLKVSHMIS